MEVVPGVYGVDFGGRVWSYIVEGGDGLTLIDAGIAGQLNVLSEFLGDIGARPEDVNRIILTHFHRDHVGLAAELRDLTGAQVIAHKAEAAVIAGREPAPEPHLTAPEELIFERVAGGIPDAPFAIVDREVGDGDEISLGSGAPAEVIHVPGHTAGSISVYVPKRGIVFTGDAAASMNGRPMVGVFNVDGEEARRSFSRIGQLGAETACFGHGEPVVGDANSAFSEAAARL